MERNKPLTLRELNSLVRQTIETTLYDEYWVGAEISEAREANGHWFAELIEKDPHSNTPTARAQARCWSRTWSVLRQHFERVAGQPPRAGMKVLLRVYASFHETYGFSWTITDIDPTYTLGDMARRRQEIVEQLKAEGVFELNKELRLPLFAQRIAVVSSASAAGYGDFVRQLTDNEYGFAFSIKLFAATMQGEQTEASVIAALNDINAEADAFDCVVIIRGGGATSDLSGFDTLALAENVANFPLPIITGIGHDRDQSVIDLVANTSVKTPTAAAALLIARLKAVADRVDSCAERIRRLAARRIDAELMRIKRMAERLPELFAMAKARRQARLDSLAERLSFAVGRRMADGRHRLELLAASLAPLASRRLANALHRVEMLEQRAKALDPRLALSRGYSITLSNGKAVRSAKGLAPGDSITTLLADGQISSTVTHNNTNRK